MKTLMVFFLLMSVYSVAGRAKPIKDTLNPEPVENKAEDAQRRKAKSRIRESGFFFTGSLGVLGAAAAVRDDEKKREADLLGHKGRHVLSGVLLGVSALLLVGGLVTFIAWVGMKKGKKKEARLSLCVPASPPGPYNRQAGVGFRLKLGR